MALLSCLLAGKAQASSCEVFLAQSARVIDRMIHPKAEVPVGNTGDYQPEAFAKLPSTAAQHIAIWHRIQDRHHASAKSVFFYDYEVRSVIQEMKRLAPAIPWLRVHNDIHKSFRERLEAFSRAQRVGYLEYHQLALDFAILYRSSIQTPLRLERDPRYSEEVFDQLERRFAGTATLTGVEELMLSRGRTQPREDVLKRAPFAIAIPTFELADEDYFNDVGEFPIGPIGLSENPGLMFDYDEFGVLQMFLHDYLHFKRSLESKTYTVAERAAYRAKLADLRALARTQEPLVAQTLNILFWYSDHELHVHKPHIAVAKYEDPDGYEAKEFRRRIFERPFDIGYFYQQGLPSEEEVRLAQRLFVKFMRQRVTR